MNLAPTLQHNTYFCFQTYLFHEKYVSALKYLELSGNQNAMKNLNLFINVCSPGYPFQFISIFMSDLSIFIWSSHSRWWVTAHIFRCFSFIFALFLQILVACTLYEIFLTLTEILGRLCYCLLCLDNYYTLTWHWAEILVTASCYWEIQRHF